MLVYVLNRHGKPLMPCQPRKARLLLKNRKAKVIKQTPFTIQLLYGSSGYIKPISLGIDAGTKYIGISATTTNNVLFEAEIQLRTDIQDLLSTRRQYRKFRRSRKTRYRKVRFNNRKKDKKWLAPSVKHKLETHIKLINKIYKILPIKNISIEVAQFNIQQLKNPEIKEEDYQKGQLFNFWNVREFVLYRDNHTCQFCKGKTKEKILNVHHIESRKVGGNSADNLITLCKICHGKIHRDGLEQLFKRKSKSFRDATQMTIMRWFLYNRVKERYPFTQKTYGYLTKNIRISLQLKKSHRVDARCISGHPLAKPMGHFYIMKQVRKNNRQLHKAKISNGGIRKANKAERYVRGFQLYDKVLFDGKECFIFGRRKSGYFDLRLLDGEVIHRSASIKKLIFKEYANTLLIERKANNPNKIFRDKAI